MNCLIDCDFRNLLTVDSNFHDDDGKFYLFASKSLAPEASTLCAFVYPELDNIFANMTVETMLANPGK